MKNKNSMRSKVILTLIMLLAFILRFWNLDSYPALNADEASNAYDAYSLIQTGMDQHGRHWPLTFQSFNDYKPGLYVYLDIPFVKMMGLTPLAARIPGALAGVLSVLVLYFLIKELKIGNWKLEIITSFLLAISPWHIHFSRGGWEVNVATFFILFGVYQFLVFIRRKKYLNMLLAILSLVLSMYTYHSARVIVPLLGFSVLFIYFKDLFTKDNSRKIIYGLTFAFLILIPLVRDLMAPGALSRVGGVGLFADQGPINRVNEQRGEHGNLDNKLGKILHNKFVNYSLAFANNYLTHFNGEFIFMSGDSIQRNKVPETGMLYLFDMLFLLIGFTVIARNYFLNPKSYFLVLSWLLIAPVASSLTFQSPNAVRAENMVVPLIIISSIGLTQVVEWLNSKAVKKYMRTICYLLLTVLIVWNFSRYLNMYYMHMSTQYPYSSQYGVKELVEFVNENNSKYSDIYVTNRYDQPYILFLFYQKYSPQKFQLNHSLTSKDDFGFSTVADYDRYHFGSIDFDSIKNNYPNSLIIGTPEEIPQTANIIKRIYGSNGFEYFDIVQN